MAPNLRGGWITPLLFSQGAATPHPRTFFLPSVLPSSSFPSVPIQTATYNSHRSVCSRLLILTLLFLSYLRIGPFFDIFCVSRIRKAYFLILLSVRLFIRRDLLSPRLSSCVWVYDIYSLGYSKMGLRIRHILDIQITTNPVNSFN